MSRQTPEIVTGARGAESADTRYTRTDSQAPRKTSGLPPGTFELHSKYAELYLQITSPMDRLDPSTGTIERTRPLKVKFHNGRAMIDDPEIVHHIYGCQDCKLHPRGLPKHPNFGPGKHFWDAQEAVELGRKKRIADAAKTFEQNPEAVARLLQDLGVKDFDLSKLGKARESKQPDSPPAT